MSSSHHTALILGGGGSAGNAWLIGVIAGLFDAGLDVTDADLIVGTSAGVTAAAQITSESTSNLYARALQPPQPRGVQAERPRQESAINHMQRTAEIIAASSSVIDMRCRLGAAAMELDAASDGSWTDRWRATVAPRLSVRSWPQREVLITAIDALTGDGVALGRDSGADLVDAIAASTSSGFPYRIGDRFYLDGGYWRNENAHLAAGYDRVLVLSPLGGRTRTPLEWGQQLEVQVAELRAGGSHVESILPDAAFFAAFGGNMMDLSTRPAAARAGHDQGESLAAELGELWR